MHVTPGDRPDHALVRSHAFHATVSVSGLAPDVLAAMLGGMSPIRKHWTPGLRVGAELQGDNSHSVDAEARQVELDDGDVTLRSGCPGNLEVHDHHRLGDTLLPQSLYLLLAQQWARAGLTTLHAAAFEYDGIGIVALGDRGAGKSVLTAAALAAGARVVSDDWLMVGRSPEGEHRAERLREFLMLRHGQASDSLLVRMPELATRSAGRRPKSVIPLREQPAGVQRCFADDIAIRQIWLLERPRTGRPEQTRAAQAATAEALAATMRAAMPLLFSKRFPAEYARLAETTNHLLKVARCRKIAGGLDLVSEPSRAFEELV